VDYADSLEDNNEIPQTLSNLERCWNESDGKISVDNLTNKLYPRDLMKELLMAKVRNLDFVKSDKAVKDRLLVGKSTHLVGNADWRNHALPYDTSIFEPDRLIPHTTHRDLSNMVDLYYGFYIVPNILCFPQDDISEDHISCPSEEGLSEEGASENSRYETASFGIAALETMAFNIFANTSDFYELPLIEQYPSKNGSNIIQPNLKPKFGPDKPLAMPPFDDGDDSASQNEKYRNPNILQRPHYLVPFQSIVVYLIYQRGHSFDQCTTKTFFSRRDFVADLEDCWIDKIEPKLKVPPHSQMKDRILLELLEKMRDTKFEEYLKRTHTERGLRMTEAVRDDLKRRRWHAVRVSQYPHWILYMPYHSRSTASQLSGGGE
jgi:hypothetical protein